MANFFDQLAAHYGSTQPFAPAQQRTMNVGAMASPFDNMPAVAAPKVVQTRQPQQISEAQQATQATPAHEANPFDQFDAPADAASTVAPAMDPTASYEVTERQRIASETFNADISNLVNGGATREQINARIAQEHAAGNQASVHGLDEALAYRDAHAGSPIAVGIANEPGLAKPADYHSPDRGALDAAGVGAFDSVTLGAGDEIGGAIGATTNAIKGAFGGGSGEDWSDAYGRIRDENRQALNDAEHYHPAAYLGGQVIGSIASLPIGGELSAGRALAEGAIYGGTYGFNSGTGNLADRVIEGAKGAALGGAMGGTIGAIGGRVARGIAERRANPSEARQILNAADNLNRGAVDTPINPILGHTSNGGLGSTITATGEQMIMPGHIGGIQRATREFEEAGGAARDRIAGDLTNGQTLNLDDAAARINDRAVPGSLVNYDRRGKVKSDALYDHAESLTPQDFRAVPRTFLPWIDTQIARLDRIAGDGPGLNDLVRIRDDIANGGGLDIASLRSLRTRFGRNFEAADGDVRGVAKQAWGRLTQDVTSSLSGDAARAWTRADANYARHLGNRDIVSRVIGDGSLSADQVADRIGKMAKSEYGTLSSALRLMPASEANNVRGALVDSLGRATSSRQDGAERFSMETFATQWDRAHLSDHAKQAIFGGSPPTLRDLDDLARLANANRAFRSKGNPSRSGVTVGNIAEVTAVGTGVGMAVMSGTVPWATLAGAAALYGGGRLLSSPGVARAVVRGSESRSIEVMARRLGEAARRNPAMAQDILGFRDAVTGVRDGAVTIDEAPQQEAPPTGEANPFDQFD
jgi:hypothetical protein